MKLLLYVAIVLAMIAVYSAHDESALSTNEDVVLIDEGESHSVS